MKIFVIKRMDNQNFTLSDISLIEALPTEDIMKILWEMKDMKTLSRMCSTSKTIRAVCNDNYFWKIKYKNDFGLNGEITIPEGMKWEELYKSRLLPNINSPISVGARHYAVIDNQGILYTAGSNRYGQLGDGTTEPRQGLIPVKAFDKKVISVSCGDSFTIAITEDGKTYMWGDKPFYGETDGEIEDDEFQNEEDSIYSKFPILIDDLKNHKAVKVSCREFGWGVILDNGSIYYTIQAEFFGYSPLTGFVSLRDRVIDLSVHSHGVAMVTENGKVYFFGDSLVNGAVDGAVGIHGNGVPYGQPLYHMNTLINPVHIPIPENIKQVSLGRSFIIALSVKGNVFTWGDNTMNRLGIDYKTRGESSNLTYQEPIKMARLSKISSIYSKHFMSAAVTEDGRVYVWGQHKIFKDIVLQLGKNAEKLGISVYTRTKHAELPIEIDIGYRVNYIAFNGTFIVEITEDGTVNYMGTNLH